MMTDTSLNLIGAAGPTIVEGPFARNREFVGMLAVATGREVLTSPAATGTSIGAALLFGKNENLVAPVPAKTNDSATVYRTYAIRWRKLVDAS